jgi:hypothetical protein
MTKTKITDVIVPEVFAPYIIQATRELSALVQSGIAVSSPVLDEIVAQGGKTVNMPFWKPLTGDDEVLSDSTALTPDKIDAAQDVAAMLIRGKAWSANELAGALAGSDPMTAIGNQVAQWWNTQEQKILISVLEGIFASALKDSHVNDISTAADAAAKISAEAILDTKQILGDAAEKFTALAMHSAVLTALQKQNLIEYIPDSQGVVNFPTYLGYKVIVDDGLAATDGVYCTYLFGEGVFGRGDGVPVSLTPVETDRDSLASDDILINRRALVLHPFGVAWQNPTIATATPKNSDLAAGANWAKVYDDKAIGIAMLRHKI